MNKQTILTSCMSALMLTASTNLHAEWKDWVIGGAVAAGVGGLIYWAAKPASPDTVKRRAEECYTTAINQNYALLGAHERNPNRATEEIILLATEKGRTYRTTRWFVSDDSYISYDCQCHAPLVRGHAALLEESQALLSHHTKLIKCFGSVDEARRAYYNFDNLEAYAYVLQHIAQTIEQHSNFMIARDAFTMHRTNIRKHEALQWQLAQTQQEIRNLRRF